MAGVLQLQAVAVKGPLAVAIAADILVVGAAVAYQASEWGSYTVIGAVFALSWVCVAVSALEHLRSAGGPIERLGLLLSAIVSALVMGVLVFFGGAHLSFPMVIWLAPFNAAFMGSWLWLTGGVHGRPKPGAGTGR